MPKSKICIILSGGTIGMVQNKKTGVLEPAKDVKSILKLLPEIQKTADIDIVNFINIDSSNMLPKYWAKLAKKIYELYDKYDGFVVTHGTDTMSYTASAVSFALQNLGKPVVFTGSMMPLSELGSDGRINFTQACMVATMDIAEVMIVLGTKIMRANRSKKYMESFSNAFHSPNFPLIGEIYRPVRLFEWRKKRNHRRKPVLKAKFESNILIVKLFPGIPVNFFENVFDHKRKGIILEAYGPGNIPCSSNESLIPIVRQARQKNIPFVVCSQMEHGTVDLSAYECGYKAMQEGIISAGDMTTEATSSKLMWALGNNKKYDKIKEIMEKNLVGERS